jgi:antitoxin (DNA-binding transcriptional repressor) of toxin-antitoxin stability system
VNIRETEVTPRVSEGQFLMVEAEQMQNGGVQVVNENVLSRISTRAIHLEERSFSCHFRYVQTVDLKDAQTRLPELVESLNAGGEIIIEANHTPVARLVPFDRAPRPLSEFAGKFAPLPPKAQDDLKMHDRIWSDPHA